MKNGVQRQLKLSLFGSTDDPQYDVAFNLIRTYERRLSPLVRCFMICTSFSADSEESLLQGGKWLTKHVDAVSVDDTVVTSLFSNENAIERIETYFNEVFLRQVLNKQINIAAEILSISSIPLLDSLTLQPFFNETLRVASYLLQVGSSSSRGFTVIVDPTLDVAQEFISSHDCLDMILLTHIPCDVVLGLNLLRDRFPSVIMIHGANIPPCGAIPIPDSYLVINVSPSKGYLDSCLNYELAFRIPSTGHGTVSLPLAVFLSPTIGLDGVCRRDLYSNHRLLPMVPTEEDVIKILGDSLNEFANKYHLNDAISHRCKGEKYPVSSTSHTKVCEGVVLLASRGSYNLINGHLESFWGTFVECLKRQSHTKALWKCIPSVSLEVGTNYTELRRYIGERSFHNSVLPSSQKIFNINLMSLKPPVKCCTSISTISNKRYTIFLDLRALKDFSSGSRGITDSVLSKTGHYWVSVPLDSSLSKYGSRKAEIWLSCFIKPHCDLVIVPPNEMSQKLVRHRLAMIGVSSDQIKFIDPTEPSSLESTYTPRRIVTHKELAVLGSPECLVIDIRSSEEFKNGSHHRSIHYPLGELLNDAQLGSSVVSSQRTILDKLAEKAASVGHCTIFCSPRGQSNTQVSSIALYCAGGYRTHIAASVLVGELYRRHSSNSTPVSVQTIYDVGGGAFQIMTQRPDMWQVKDRSIICIS